MIDLYRHEKLRIERELQNAQVPWTTNGDNTTLVLEETTQKKGKTLLSMEREVLYRHYLLGENFQTVGHNIGFSKSWATELHRRALKKLKEIT